MIDGSERDAERLAKIRDERDQLPIEVRDGAAWPPSYRFAWVDVDFLISVIDARDAEIAALKREVERLRAAHDDPDMDATDYAHPAWWRAHDHTTEVFCREANAILDGKEPGGVSSEPWQSLRLRLWEVHREGVAASREAELAGAGRGEASENAMRIAQRTWYEQLDGKAKSPGWIIIAYAKAIDAALAAAPRQGIEEAAQVIDAVIEAAREIAEYPGAYSYTVKLKNALAALDAEAAPTGPAARLEQKIEGLPSPGHPPRHIDCGECSKPYDCSLKGICFRNPPAREEPR